MYSFNYNKLTKSSHLIKIIHMQTSYKSLTLRNVHVLKLSIISFISPKTIIHSKLLFIQGMGWSCNREQLMTTTKRPTWKFINTLNKNN